MPQFPRATLERNTAPREPCLFRLGLKFRSD